MIIWLLIIHYNPRKFYIINNIINIIYTPDIVWGALAKIINKFKTKMKYNTRSSTWIGQESLLNP